MSKDFGLNLNYENMITENLLSYPITKLIDGTAEKDGIDTKNPERRLFALGGSAFLSQFCCVDFTCI